MRVVTIGQVLDHVGEFEDLLADFYHTFSEENPHEGVRLLTDYMSRHTHHIQECLKVLPPDSAKQILSIPLSYEPHVPDCRCFEEIDLPPNPDAAHVLDAAVLLDECIMQLYRQVLRQPLDWQIKEFFEELIRILESEEVQLKKIKAMNYF